VLALIIKPFESHHIWCALRDIQRENRQRKDAGQRTCEQRPPVHSMSLVSFDDTCQDIKKNANGRAKRRKNRPAKISASDLCVIPGIDSHNWQ
jgi:hypothetical protein